MIYIYMHGIPVYRVLSVFRIGSVSARCILRTLMAPQWPAERILKMSPLKTRFLGFPVLFHEDVHKSLHAKG